MRKLVLVSMSGLRVGCDRVLAAGMRLPGLRKRADALSQLPPLGLLTVAGTIPESWEPHLLQDDGVRAIESVVDEIFSHSPDVVAFSTLTPAADRAADIGLAVNKRGVSTIVGGLHATAIPDWCQSKFTTVAIGDGESLMPQILRDYEDGSPQELYRAPGDFDLCQSPLPRWDLLHGKPQRFTLQTVRGCPWACSFCAASRLLGRARVKSNEQIQRELDVICDQAPRPWLELADDNTFAIDRDHNRMLDILADCGARWFTESDWRIGQSPKLLRKIAKSGCRQVLVGVESTVFRYPGMGRKSAELARVVDAIETIQAHGIAANACFIVGADGETQDSIDRLREFLHASTFSEIQLTIQTPFPGTSLYKELHQQERLLYNDFSRYTLFDVVHRPDCLSVEELREQFALLVESVFSPAQQTRRELIRRQVYRAAKYA